GIVGVCPRTVGGFCNVIVIDGEPVFPSAVPGKCEKGQARSADEQSRTGGLCELGFREPFRGQAEKNRKKPGDGKVETNRGQVEPVFEDQFQGDDGRFDYKIQKEPGDPVCDNGKSPSEP